MPLNPGDLVIGRYRIEDKLGEGSLWTAYRAIDSLHKRACTLKAFQLERLSAPGAAPQPAVGIYSAVVEPALPARTREQVAETLWREVRLLARLEHPNLVKVMDFFSTGDTYYLVMPLTGGHSLAAAEGAPFSEVQVLDWLDLVLDALAICHEEGILHRNISPASLVRVRGDRVLLVDFDLAGDCVATALGIASPYRAPELYESGSHADARSDVYALGATLYFLLSGREPGLAPDRLSGASMVEFRQLAPQISSEVEAAVLRALALDPAERFQSVRGLRLALASEPPAEEGAEIDWAQVTALQVALEASHRPLIFYDDFADDHFGWDTGHSEDELSTGSQEIGGGRYRWQVKALEGFSWWSCPDVSFVQDFYLTVQARQQRGQWDSEYGVILRAMGDDHYTFSIRDDQQFSAYLDYQGEQRELLAWSPSRAIVPDGANQLTVIAHGPHFRLLINDQYVGEFDDETLLEGKVGLLIGLEQPGDTAVFEFERFELREL